MDDLDEKRNSSQESDGNGCTYSAKRHLDKVAKFEEIASSTSLALSAS